MSHILFQPNSFQGSVVITYLCTMLNKQGFEFLGTYRERMRICAVIRDLEVDMVEQDFMNEKRSAAREYEEQKVYLRDQLIHELEEKQRMIVSSIMRY